jgi:ribosomal protein L7/L12
MTPLLATLEFNDYAIIAGIVVVFAGAAAYTVRPDINLQRLERQMRELQQKLDALLKHEGIELPTPPASDMSPEVQMMANDPRQKISAIKLYRQEHPGVGLAEAKNRIEEFNKIGR